MPLFIGFLITLLIQISFDKEVKFIQDLILPKLYFKLLTQL